MKATVVAAPSLPRPGKLARPGKGSGAAASPTATAPAESGEESGGSGMGVLKRKRTSPPESPVPSKKPSTEESGPLWSSSTGELPEVLPGKSQALAGDSRVTKQVLGQPHESVAGVLAAEEAVVSGGEKESDDPKTKLAASVENVSHGQGASFQTQESAAGALVLTSKSPALAPARPHLIPSHAGWFQWTKIHQLERLGLPEFFSGKNPQKTPETYVEHRNLLITKYRENPPKLMKLEDVQGLMPGAETNGIVRVFEFLDHWGLVNYQALSDFSRFTSPKGPVGSVEEASDGTLQLVPHSKQALANLFQFDGPRAPAPKLLSPPSTTNIPLASLAEALVQESLSAPAVEYHCNSCQADCSKRRYHCQKQADFDLCPDCYNDGKFGEGMTSTDFLRMDALTETGDANGGGWSDQETLLLLEALELYGDNWNEIAEHVATKSKAQCILHFIRLPIEDPFLEDMEVLTSGITAPPPPPGVSNSMTPDPANQMETLPEVGNTGNTSRDEVKEDTPQKSENDASKPGQQQQKDNFFSASTLDKNSYPQSAQSEKENSLPNSNQSTKAEECKVASAILAAAETAGSSGPDGLIAFADAGNPVMAQVAFLAAMVGPRVAATAAQAALKALGEEDPVGYLSAKNSFGLESPDIKVDKVAVQSVERSTEPQSTQSQSLVIAGGPIESSDCKATEATTVEEGKEDHANVISRSDELKTGEVGGRKLQKVDESRTTCTSVQEEDGPSVARVRNAAATSLASAAVKAKLLADQEEREIQRLVASVIENQLKKLELKLKQFGELETMLGKECEQVEKARAKVYTERARIVASRLGSNASPSQAQTTGSTPASFTKVSSQPPSTIAVAQPKPAVFTFGPSGISAPVGVPKTSSGAAGGSSMPVDTPTQPPSNSQVLTRPMIGTNMASGPK